MADVAAPIPPPPPPAAAGAVVGGWRGWLASTLERPALLFVQGVCLPGGLVLFVVGGTDAATAATFPAKVFGAGLAVVGIALLATAAGIRSDRPWPGTVGSSSLAAAAAIAAYLAVSAWDEERKWALSSAAIAVGSVPALVLLVRERRPVFGVKLASVLGIAGFAFTFFQFTYAQSAVTRVGPTIQLTPDLVAVGDQETPQTLAVTIKAANKTGAKVQVLGDLYLLEGILLCQRTRTTSDQALFLQYLSTDDPDDAYTSAVGARRVTTVQAGRVFENGTYFEPGEEIVRRFSVPVPTFAYDVFRLRVKFAVANGDRLHLGGIRKGPSAIEGDAKGMQGASMTWEVTESSLVDRLAHADREVVVRWESGTGADVRPDLDAMVRLPGDPAADTVELSNRYGVVFVTSSVDIPVQGPLNSIGPGPGPPDDGPQTACRADW